MPVVPVDHETQIVVHSRDIEGFVPHPTGVFRFEKGGCRWYPAP